MRNGQRASHPADNQHHVLGSSILGREIKLDENPGYAQDPSHMDHLLGGNLLSSLQICAD
jgi:hypothetical protein